MYVAGLIEKVNVPEADWVEFHWTTLPLLSLIPVGPNGLTYVKVPEYVSDPLAVENADATLDRLEELLDVAVVELDELLALTVLDVREPGPDERTRYPPPATAATIITTTMARIPLETAAR